MARSTAPGRSAKIAQIALAGMLVCAASTASAASAASAPLPKLFKETWIDGTQPQEPVVQVQALDGDTFVIRQSIKTNFEAPFLYLLFGHDKALLIDTGAKDGQIRPAIDRLIADWLKAHGRSDIPLVVAHSHSHGDHVAGDAAFRDRPNTTLVGLKSQDVAAFFGITNWPDGIAQFDLGGRVLTIIPTPGHQQAAIMVYDPRQRILLSGDTLYPGRLYVPANFMAEERASVDRLAAFAAHHPIRALLGAHIEMTRTPTRDYGHEAATHPDEHPLELPAETIGELKAGLAAAPGALTQPQVHDRFIIVPVPARTE